MHLSYLNKVTRHKTRDESQFRVHFYIKSVYFDPNMAPQVFLEGISTRLSKIIPVGSVQINTPLKRFVQISVGVHSDLAACNFLESGRRLLLPGESGNPVEHEIVVSDAFLTYCRIRKNSRAESNKNSPEENYKSENDSSSSSYLERKRQRQNWKRRFQREDEDLRVNFLWIFCVPIDCKQREVCSALAEKGIRVKNYDWKFKEDMQYLQVELLDSINLRELDVIDCRIEKYPILIIPRLQDQKNVYQHILKHELEINFQKDIDQIELIKFVNRVGGVLLFIKDEFYGPKKYVIALNCSSKVEIMKEELTRKYKNCYIQRPKHPVRLGRLQKSFSFAQIVENLVAYELQL